MHLSLSGSHNSQSSSCCHQHSTSDLFIRLATLEEVGSIAELLTHSFHYFSHWMWWLYPLMKLAVGEDLRSRFSANNPRYHCIVAVIPRDGNEGKQEKIIGTVELSVRTNYHWLAKKEYPYLANLAVEKGYRRKGVGSQLLKHCEEIARNWGFHDLNLHVLVENQQAQQLYLKNGYTIQQEETDLYSLFVTSQRRLLLTKSI